MLYQLSYIGLKPAVSCQLSALSKPTFTPNRSHRPGAVLHCAAALTSPPAIPRPPAFPPEIWDRGVWSTPALRALRNRPARWTGDSQISGSQNFWCTGKDSNLRTSLGGTDLQSVGFNHSPTCANTLGRCGRCALSGRLRYQGRSKAHAKPADQTQNSFTFSQHRETKARARRPRRSLTSDRQIHPSTIIDHCTPEKYRMECVGKTCCAANRVRHLPEHPSRRSFTGAGEGI